LNGTRAKPDSSGSKPGLDLAAAGRGQRRHGAAVEGLFHHDDGRHLDALAVAIQARQLDRRLVGLAARVAEEGAVHAGQFAQPVGQFFLARHAIQVRRMDQGRSLVGNRLHQFRMGMAQPVHRHPGDRIEITLAGLIPQVGAFAAHERDGLAGIGVHQMCCHGRSLQAVKSSCWFEDGSSEIENGGLSRRACHAAP
jgi:hypothetical protein